MEEKTIVLTEQEKVLMEYGHLHLQSHSLIMAAESLISTIRPMDKNKTQIAVLKVVMDNLIAKTRETRALCDKQLAHKAINTEAHCPPTNEQ